MIGRLVLVKHSHPHIEPDVPAAGWRLDDEGHARAVRLASRLRTFTARRIVTSIEPKAHETADIVGRELGLPVEPVRGLHEHDRNDGPFLGAEDFDRSVAMLFARPRELVFGNETAEQAARRFATAIDRALREETASDAIVVAHGTVISLFCSPADPLTLWKRLGLPSYVVLSLPARAILDVVDRV
ncbi:MAG: histidine phosphatase family protein [Chloroflexi bacterium]|nr:histidine phosphatase family protein [Chloroflexota bacterium]